MKSHVFLAAAVVGFLNLSAHAQTPASAEPAAVTVTEDANSFTLSNGIVTARVAKRNGDLSNLFYKGTDTLTDQSGHARYVLVPTTPPGGMEHITKITIDPKDNKGERAEVSVKAVSGGRPGSSGGTCGKCRRRLPRRYRNPLHAQQGRAGHVHLLQFFDHKLRVPRRLHRRGPLLRQARQHV